MASCAQIDANGFVRIDSTTPVAECAAFVLLSREDYSAVKTAGEPFDYAHSATLWGFAFSSVLLCWFVARGAGTLLGLIRKG